MTTQEKYLVSFTTSHVISSLIFAKEVKFNLRECESFSVN